MKKNREPEANGKEEISFDIVTDIDKIAEELAEEFAEQLTSSLIRILEDAITKGR